MGTEMLEIDGKMVRHKIIKMIGDGACLFRALSHFVYGNQLRGQDIREAIIDNVMFNWKSLQPLTHDNSGNNYPNPTAYKEEMILPSTYGSTCEVVAATNMYPFSLEVYRDGKLYQKFGTNNPPKRIRYTSSLSSGHFDVYEPVDAEHAEEPSTKGTQTSLAKGRITQRPRRSPKLSGVTKSKAKTKKLF